ncbi:uncharacterized protein LOC127755684 [Oryza glaberrima]|uniref:uncharacterized protein LOC127755684 n=1 Tax=Oryza glaberrima TaxID=4538 RepID=UPI00224C049E|nr:uncharacterized protein LOC127755684 [Oryza glaberrima]
MGRKKRLNIVQSSLQYCSGQGTSNEHSSPQVEPPEAFEDDGIHDEQQDDGTLNISGEDDVKKRGPTMLPYVWDLPDGKRIVVKCNKLGQPIGAEGGLLGQFLGTIARNGSYCPLDKKTWRKVKENKGDLTILQFVQTKFLYPHFCEKWILKSIGRDWRRFKAALKEKWFNPKKKRSSLYKLCPEDIEKDKWEALINYWKSKKGKILSAKNKRSRAMLKNPHSAGTKSYARWSDDMRQDDPNKKQPHRAHVYLATHKKRGNDKDEHVAELENLVEEQPELAQNDQGRVAWEGDALHKVLGEEKPGHVHGMGLLPVPKQVYGHTSHHLKNINITTVDHSSDEDMDVRQELRELKELLKKHEKAIEEQQNKETCNGKSGPTKVNYERAYDGNVQEQAIRANRKRIQCNARELDESESEQRITSMNKKRHREQLNMHENTDMEHLGYEVDHNHKEIPSHDDSSSLYAQDFRQETIDISFNPD